MIWGFTLLTFLMLLARNFTLHHRKFNFLANNQFWGKTPICLLICIAHSSGPSLIEDLSTDVTFDPTGFSWDRPFNKSGKKRRPGSFAKLWELAEGRKDRSKLLERRKWKKQEKLRSSKESVNSKSCMSEKGHEEVQVWYGPAQFGPTLSDPAQSVPPQSSHVKVGLLKQ